MLLLVALCTTAFSQNAKPQWMTVIDNSPASMKSQLVSSSEESIKIHVQVPGFYTTTVSTPQGEAKVITVPSAVSTAHAGEPDVPMMGIPAIIGDQARMNIRVVEAKYKDFDNIVVAPSKGDFPRTIDPATVPYTYGDCYNKDAFFPANSAELYEPYILRDYRGQNMAVHPFVYNPVTKTLRVYYDLTVEMYKVDDNGKNPLTSRHSKVVMTDPDFKNVYGRHFINYEASQSKYTPVDEEGDLLIICYDNFINAMTDFVNWKKTRGVNTTIVGTSTAGTSYSAIKTYIQNQYNANNNLTHVLLVGDVDQIPGYSYSGGGSEYSGLGDNAYGQIVGNDIYNDVFIGRFSASNAAQVTTQVNKVITYERDLTTSASWLQKAEGISRKENGSGHNNEDDYQHMDNIRTDLLNYGYTTVYQRYANLTGYDGSSSTISSDINNGVGIINYTNHGQETAWGGNSSGYIYYTNSHVNALTNENKLPFIFSVACLVGKYDHSNDCFAETWMRATNNNNPTGAVGTVMSYISQPWIPPMWAQDEFIDILVDSYSNNIKHTWGGTAINGLMGIFDHYSTSESSAVGTYQAWILYGDPSMMLRTKTPQAMTVTHQGEILSGVSSYTVAVSNGDGALVTITDANHNILGKSTVSNGTANISLNGTPDVGSTLTLCVFGYNKVTYLETIQVITPEGPYISLDSYTPSTALVGEDTDLSLTFKNMGVVATTGITTVTLTSEDNNVTIVSGHNTGSFGELAVNATVTLSDFKFRLGSGVTLGSDVILHYSATNGSNTWEGDFSITPNQVFAVTVASNNDDYGTVSVSGNGQFDYDTSCTVTATPADGYMFTNWTQNGNVISTDAEYTFNVTSDINLVANFAEGVMIGDGGTATNEYLPSYNYYNYTLSEQIYTPAELGGAGIITSIAFYNGGAEKTRTLDFYMKATTKSSFTGQTDWIAVSSSDKVFSGSVTMVANGWTTVTFTTPFLYDGTSNVVLVTDDNTGTYTNSPHMSCRVFSATNQALYAYNDNTNFDPLSPPTSSSTNNAVLSVKNQLIVTKEAMPTGAINITVSASPAQAGTVTGGGEYQFGETCTVTATPNTDYMFTGWTENGAVISTELSFSFSVVSDRNLVANFIQATEIGEGTLTNNYLPTFNYYNYSMTEQIYTADEIGTAGTITSIAFYNEGAEKTRTLDLYLKATDKEAFSSKTDWVTVSASDKVFSGEVTMLANNWTFITFNTPYEYDGTSNLVLVTDDNSGTYTSSPHIACSVYNTSSTQAIYIYSDGINYNPSSPTTSQSSNYATLSVKNHILLAIESTSSDCMRPNGLTATEIGPNFVKLNWNENGTSEEWVVACGNRTVTANTNEGFVLDGLTPGTDYTIKVRPACSENLWSSEITVTTISPCPIPTDLNVSGITHNSAVVSWTGSNDTYELQYAKKDMQPLTYDFENGWQGWTAFKGTTGTSTHNWIHNTEYVAYDSNGNQIVPECHNSSEGMMLSESYISAATSGGSGTAVYPDNYLVSPQIQLGGSFTFYAAARMSNYPAEKFSVLLSKAGNASASDFTKTLLTVTLEDNEWHEYTVDLSDYSGWGYVAIRHYDCYDQHLLYIDDVTINDGAKSSWTTVSGVTSPCTLTDLDSEALYVVKVKALNGNEESDWSEEMEFATLGLLELADDDSGVDVQNNSDIISENANVVTDVKLNGRTLYKDNAWNTICLPFDVNNLSGTLLEGATLKELDTADAYDHVTGVDGSTLYLNFKNADAIEAGKPYIIMWTSGDDIKNPTFSGVNIPATYTTSEAIADALDDEAVTFEGGKFVGTFSSVPYSTETNNILFVGGNNTLYWPKPTQDNPIVTIGAFRAYFQLDNPAAVRSFSLNFGDNRSNGITTTNYTNEDGAWYTLDGRKLPNIPKRKGVYIQNGAKVVVK